jgi:hypothetical protein
VAAALFGIAVIATACSSGPSGPAVAGSGTTTTTSAAAGAAASPGKPDQSRLLAYSKCMQTHGVRDFPDPNSQGRLTLQASPGSDLDPNNPTFAAAQQTCQHLMPQPTPAQKAQALEDGLKVATCMRAHGIKDFPDPNSSGGISIQVSPGSDLDPNNPAFQAAQKACQTSSHGGNLQISGGSAHGQP